MKAIIARQSKIGDLINAFLKIFELNFFYPQCLVPINQNILWLQISVNKIVGMEKILAIKFSIN